MCLKYQYFIIERTRNHLHDKIRLFLDKIKHIFKDEKSSIHDKIYSENFFRNDRGRKLLDLTLT